MYIILLVNVDNQERVYQWAVFDPFNFNSLLYCILCLFSFSQLLFLYSVRSLDVFFKFYLLFWCIFVFLMVVRERLYTRPFGRLTSTE